MGTEILAPLFPKLESERSSTATYARRCRTDCPDANGVLSADGYYVTPQGWREGNYLSASQGRHEGPDGEPKSNRGDSSQGSY